MCAHACIWSSHQPPSLAPTQAEDHQGLSLPASCHPYSSCVSWGSGHWARTRGVRPLAKLRGCLLQHRHHEKSFYEKTFFL